MGALLHPIKATKPWLWFAFALLAAGLMGMISWQIKLRAPPEPVYQGKTLSFWVNRVAVPQFNTPPQFDPPPEAVAALHAIGENCLPYLIKWLAVAAFRCLGAEARYSIPALSNTLYKSEVYETSAAAADALGWIGSEAVPALVAGLTNVPPGMIRIADVRTRILEQFIRMQKDTTSASAVPIIVHFAEATERGKYVRAEALLALGFLRYDPKKLAPLITAALADEDPYLRATGLRALTASKISIVQDFDLLAATSSVRQRPDQGYIPASTVVRLANDPDDDVRMFTAILLGKLADPAATSALIGLTNDPSGKVRSRAIEALKHPSHLGPG